MRGEKRRKKIANQKSKCFLRRKAQIKPECGNGLKCASKCSKKMVEQLYMQDKLKEDQENVIE